MNNTKRVLAAVALAGAALSFTGTAMASQGDSQGNIGSVARDESFNFNSQTFGDSVNNRIGNVINTVGDLEGTGHQPS
ncbi:hypothetical protein [Streptomyces lavendofoliae]|uniref:Secreted protein n=1 Tax=Streptomyces lavendofoliae TaxID=67314 RepID=A0A918I4I1_9ACTN|nr:hypothetical protein [Streptomyces lavendofoliae]GGU68170.1 hypothetical protein GCM10010274_65660 [Streptomyces lavendofoliae]